MKAKSRFYEQSARLDVTAAAGGSDREAARADSTLIELLLNRGGDSEAPTLGGGGLL